METSILIILIFVLLLVIIIFVKIFFLKDTKTNENDLSLVKKEVIDIIANHEKNIENSIKLIVNPYFVRLEEKMNFIENQLERIDKNGIDNNRQIADIIGKNQIEMLKMSEEKNDKILSLIKDNLKDFTLIISEKINDIRRVTENNLTEIKHNVDEKLDKTLDTRLKQSFENIVNQISSVDKAIGEIKGLANDVGSLKNVLTNVKTKGIVGEVMLSSIIKEILSPEQYEENVVTKKGSSERVEFAVKMPGGNGEYCYLPIDSKFPLESYYKIKEGMENGDALLIEESRKELKNKIKSFAKDISNKYIDAPNTTDFAIMFVPLEGIYVEIIEMGLFEVIQREYKVNIVGPSTFAALLNALQMGFKSYIIQKRSGEVFKLLGAVKTEFEAFAGVLERAQKRVNEANDELDKLVGVRTRKIQSKLKNIASLDEKDASEILEIEKN